MSFVNERPFAKPEAAAQKLLEIILRADIDVGQYTYTGITNSTFTREGGNVVEYSNGIAYAVTQRWFEVDRSGTRIFLLRAGIDPRGASRSS
jgi:hypothetical protein